MKRYPRVMCVVVFSLTLTCTLSLDYAVKFISYVMGCRSSLGYCRDGLGRSKNINVETREANVQEEEDHIKSREDIFPCPTHGKILFLFHPRGLRASKVHCCGALKSDSYW